MIERALVSCLCVTRDRVPLLRRAVHCFLSQTYRYRELIVVYEADDLNTREYLHSLCEPSIFAIEAPSSPRTRLGSLRNLSVQAAHGRYVAQWDDDDWYAPERLAVQMVAIQQSSKPACVLSRWTIFDAQTSRACLSNARTWEGSLVADRAFLPPYADESKAEDTPVIATLLDAERLVTIDRPDLYVYVYHGQNTWDRAHWERNVLQFGSMLDEKTTDLVKGLLNEGRICANEFPDSKKMHVVEARPELS